MGGPAALHGMEWMDGWMNVFLVFSCFLINDGCMDSSSVIIIQTSSVISHLSLSVFIVHFKDYSTIHTSHQSSESVYLLGGVNFFLLLRVLVLCDYVMSLEEWNKRNNTWKRGLGEGEERRWMDE